MLWVLCDIFKEEGSNVSIVCDMLWVIMLFGTSFKDVVLFNLLIIKLLKFICHDTLFSLHRQKIITCQFYFYINQYAKNQCPKIIHINLTFQALNNNQNNISFVCA